MADIICIIDILQKLTNTRITQSDIARALKVTRASISKRVKTNSIVSVEELKIIGRYYGVNLINALIKENGNADGNILADTESFSIVNYTDNLKLIRQKLNLSVSKAAKLLDVSLDTFNSYESGGNEPPLKFLEKLYKIFSVNIHWFVTNKGDMFYKEPEQSSPKFKFDAEFEEAVLNVLKKNKII